MRCDSIILLGWQQSFLKAYMLKRKEPRRVAEYQAVPGTRTCIHWSVVTPPGRLHFPWSKQHCQHSLALTLDTQYSGLTLTISTGQEKFSLSV